MRKKRDLASRFIGNTGWMMFKNIYSMLVSLIVGSLSARYLGPSNYGLISYASSIISFFTTVSKLGMDTVVVAEIVRKPEKEGSYLGSALVMRLITSILSFFAIWGLMLVLEPGNTLLIVVTILQAIAIVFQTTEVLYYWFQARLEMKYVTIAGVLALTVTGIWRISLLANEATVQWFAFSSSISALVSGISIVYFYLRKSKVKLSVSLPDCKFILSRSAPFIVNGLAVTLYTQLDRIMLGRVVSETAVGYYSAASTIAVMWEFVPTAITNSARPLLVSMYEKGRAKFEYNYKMILVGISLLGLLVGVFFTVFAKLIVYILYGEAYYSAIPALSILIWSTSFAMIGTARGIWIVSENKNKYPMYFTLSGAILNAVLNAMVIPTFGVTGASVTTLVTQCFTAIFMPSLFKETRYFCKLYFSSFKLFPDMMKMAKKYVSDKIKTK